jgi:hypothetical protein
VEAPFSSIFWTLAPWNNILTADYNYHPMQATVIDPADMGALESALNENKVSNQDSC